MKTTKTVRSLEAAAQEDQLAMEDGSTHRGEFTSALVEVLQNPNADNLAATRIFDRLVVQMKINSVPHEPAIVGPMVH